MDAITMLTEQHSKLRTLFSAFDGASTSAERTAVFEDIQDELSVHTTLEEKVFYPAAYAGEPQHVLASALEDHRALKRALVELMDMNVGTERFQEKLWALREQVEAHVTEEEEVLFPRARARLGAPALRELWVKMEVLFTREALHGPTRNLVEQVQAY